MNRPRIPSARELELAAVALDIAARKEKTPSRKECLLTVATWLMRIRQVAPDRKE